MYAICQIYTRFKSSIYFIVTDERYPILQLLMWGLQVSFHGPVTRYPKLRVAHAPGNPGTLSPPPRLSDPDMHHGTCVTPVPWCMPSSLTGGFLWSRWRGKRSRHSRRMHKLQFCVSGKRPMTYLWTGLLLYVGCLIHETGRLLVEPDKCWGSVVTFACLVTWIGILH